MQHGISFFSLSAIYSYTTRKTTKVSRRNSTNNQLAAYLITVRKPDYSISPSPPWPSDISASPPLAPLSSTSIA